MKNLLILLGHLLTTIPKLLAPGGAKAIVELKRRNPRFGCPRIAQQINLRILGTDEVRTVPYTPPWHPFVERLIRTIRLEFLDQTLANDVDRKLVDFLQYYNSHHSHTALDGSTPAE